MIKFIKLSGIALSTMFMSCVGCKFLASNDMNSRALNVKSYSSKNVAINSLSNDTTYTFTKYTPTANALIEVGTYLIADANSGNVHLLSFDDSISSSNYRKGINASVSKNEITISSDDTDHVIWSVSSGQGANTFSNGTNRIIGCAENYNDNPTYLIQETKLTQPYKKFNVEINGDAVCLLNTSASGSSSRDCSIYYDSTNSYFRLYAGSEGERKYVYLFKLSHKVTFDANGHGTAPDVQTVFEKGKATAPTTPSATGYTFGGWYKEAACTNPWDFETVVSEDTTLYAKWTPNTYTITYKDINGVDFSGTHEQGYPTTHTYDETTNLKSANKTGYTFGGWHKKADCSDNAITSIGGTDFTDNFTLYTKWTPITYNITYELDGGVEPSPSNPKTYTIETDTITLKNPTKTGYTFGGWFDNKELSGTAVTQISKGSTGDKKLYAKWTINDYSITYHNVDGATHSNPNSYTIQTPTISLKNATKNGYTFGGWFDNKELSGTAVTQISKGSTGDKNLYAKWTINNYSITYHNVDGATHSNPSSYTIETPTISLKDATKNGYTFKGWYSDNKFQKPITSIEQGSTGDKEIYAKWNTNTYNITYELNGGVEPSPSNPKTYTIETDTITLKNPTKTGYTFGGWFDNKEFSGTAVTQISKGSTGDKKLYAKWSINRHTISVTTSTIGGKVSGAGTFNYGADCTLTATPDEHYSFIGWYEGNDVEPIMDNPYTFKVAGDRTLVAKFKADSYKIQYKDQGGTDFSGVHEEGAPINHTYGSDTILKNATKDGYTFKGWYKESDCSGNVITKLGATEYTEDNITLYAKWNEVCSVSFDMQGHGTQLQNIPVEKGERIDKVEDPKVDGFIFGGWYKDSEYKNQWNFDTDKVESNITLYAKWTAVPSKKSNIVWIIIGSIGGAAIIGVTTFLIIKNKRKSKSN